MNIYTAIVSAIKKIDPRTYIVAVAAFCTCIGALLTLLGIYSAFYQHKDFSYYGIPIFLVVLGQLGVYNAALGTACAVVKRSDFVKHAYGLYVCFILAELTSLAYMSSGPPSSMEGDFRLIWTEIYETNKWRLISVEHLNGCCGFADKYDMAVPKRCSNNTEFGYSRGCYEAMKDNVGSMYNIVQLYLWIIVLTQFIVLIVASAIYQKAIVEHGLNQEEVVESDYDRDTSRNDIGIPFSQRTALQMQPHSGTDITNSSYQEYTSSEPLLARRPPLPVIERSFPVSPEPIGSRDEAHFPSLSVTTPLLTRRCMEFVDKKKGEAGIAGPSISFSDSAALAPDRAVSPTKSI